MTIQDLGSLGELIAAIATVATLVYLSLQIRHNTRALEHAEEREILDDGNLWRSHLIQNPEIAELYRKGLLDPNALDPIERLRFRMLLDALFTTWLYAFRSGHHGGYTLDFHIRGTLARPGGKQYWVDQKSNYVAAFVQYVDNLADDESG